MKHLYFFFPYSDTAYFVMDTTTAVELQCLVLAASGVAGRVNSKCIRQVLI